MMSIVKQFLEKQRLGNKLRYIIPIPLYFTQKKVSYLTFYAKKTHKRPKQQYNQLYNNSILNALFFYKKTKLLSKLILIPSL